MLNAYIVERIRGILWSKLKYQNVYECQNLDFERTYESLCGVLPGVDKTRKGHISFRISSKKIAVLISPKGKVQVAWENEEEKQKFLASLESLLKTDNDQKTELKPLYANVVNVPYPPPEHFSFAWCKEKFTFFQKLGLFLWMERRATRKRQEREYEDAKRKCDIAAHWEIMFLDGDDPGYLGKREDIKETYRKKYGLQQ